MGLLSSLLAVACLTALAAPAAAGEKPSRGRLCYTLATRTRDHTPAEQDTVARRLDGGGPLAVYDLLGAPDAVTYTKRGRVRWDYRYKTRTLTAEFKDWRVVNLGWAGSSR